jgi:hypothetical protein
VFQIQIHSKRIRLLNRYPHKKIQDPDPGSGSRMNTVHISASLKTIFWVKILKFFDAYPGWKKFGSRIEKFRPGINRNSTAVTEKIPWLRQLRDRRAPVC